MYKKYEDSLVYQLNALAKYTNLLFEDYFKQNKFELSGTEHLALTIINESKDICQRDLAKILVKDRSNTGKIAQALEKKGLIKINLTTKNNRPVKILTPTTKGKNTYKKTLEKINPAIESIYTGITPDEIESIKNGLKKFKSIIEKVAKTNI